MIDQATAVRQNSFSRAELEEMARSNPFWFHSIDLGNGVVTNGMKSQKQLAREVESFKLPDLRGKSVLDIGAYDGFFSFEAERRGARRVVSLDHFMWSIDLPEHIRYWRECKEKGIVPQHYEEMPHWRPDELPGKRGYDTAHKALSSKAEPVVADYMLVTPEEIGTFDVVFYFGVLYHMQNPFAALQKVAELTHGVAVIETEGIYIPGYENTALTEFFETNELNGDVSNWCAHNKKGLEAMCRAAGFSTVQTMVGPPRLSFTRRLRATVPYVWSALFNPEETTQSRVHLPKVRRFRAVVHARK